MVYLMQSAVRQRMLIADVPTFFSQVLINQTDASGALEGFILKRCEESIHLVMLVSYT